VDGERFLLIDVYILFRGTSSKSDESEVEYEGDAELDSISITLTVWR